MFFCYFSFLKKIFLYIYLKNAVTTVKKLLPLSINVFLVTFCNFVTFFGYLRIQALDTQGFFAVFLCLFLRDVSRKQTAFFYNHHPLNRIGSCAVGGFVIIRKRILTFSEQKIKYHLIFCRHVLFCQPFFEPLYGINMINIIFLTFFKQFPLIF